MGYLLFFDHYDDEPIVEAETKGEANENCNNECIDLLSEQAALDEHGAEAEEASQCDDDVGVPETDASGVCP
jgi:hypothetical protein